MLCVFEKKLSAKKIQKKKKLKMTIPSLLKHCAVVANVGRDSHHPTYATPSNIKAMCANL